MTPQQEGGRGGGGQAGRTDRDCSGKELETRPSAGIAASIHKFNRARTAVVVESTPLRTRNLYECSCSHVTERAEHAKSRGEHTWRRGACLVRPARRHWPVRLPAVPWCVPTR
jgi:hypothetical protein